MARDTRLPRIENEAALTALYPEVVPAALRKVTPVLTPLYRRWIETARFFVLSTVGPDGVHGSPRGDDGPAVRVQDDATLMVPDWRGNNRLDCLRDIIADGRVALMFLVPGSNTALRVNGRAFLTDDETLRASFAKNGKLPATVVVIDIAEVYAQCAKALMRADLWNRDDTGGLPTIGQMLAEASRGVDGGAEYDKAYPDYAKPRMW